MFENFGRLQNRGLAFECVLAEKISNELSPDSVFSSLSCHILQKAVEYGDEGDVRLPVEQVDAAVLELVGNVQCDA